MALNDSEFNSDYLTQEYETPKSGIEQLLACKEAQIQSYLNYSKDKAEEMYAQAEVGTNKLYLIILQILKKQLTSSPRSLEASIQINYENYFNNISFTHKNSIPNICKIIDINGLDELRGSVFYLTMLIELLTCNGIDCSNISTGKSGTSVIDAINIRIKFEKERVKGYSNLPYEN